MNLKEKLRNRAFLMLTFAMAATIVKQVTEIMGMPIPDETVKKASDIFVVVIDFLCLWGFVHYQKENQK